MLGVDPRVLCILGKFSNPVSYQGSARVSTLDTNWLWALVLEVVLRLSTLGGVELRRQVMIIGCPPGTERQC